MSSPSENNSVIVNDLLQINVTVECSVFDQDMHRVVTQWYYIKSNEHLSAQNLVRFTRLTFEGDPMPGGGHYQDRLILGEFVEPLRGIILLCGHGTIFYHFRLEIYSKS